MNLEQFQKNKEYLICVDSDGCAMDTMDIKHIRCFGPCMVKEWGLENWESEILERWNQINLYTMTRGINRFKGLAMALKEISDTKMEISGIDELLAWTEKTPELSNRAVEAEYSRSGADIFAKALSWSNRVNEAINALEDQEKQPFDNVLEGLIGAHQVADIAVVSSANRDAVEEEWNRYHLLQEVDILLCQDAGSKAHCIEELLKKGYARDHVLMVGDAPGDLAAAEMNGVFFYPVLVKRESESWRKIDVAVSALINGTYKEMQEQTKQQFLENLSEGK